MEPWHIIVALIQGLVEWLPISSEGQVFLFLYAMGSITPTEIATLVIWLHLGTTLAVLVRYPRTILEIITLKDRNLLKLLIIATIGTALTAIPIYMYFRTALTETQGELLNVVVGILLLVTALALYLPTRGSSEEREVDTREPEEQIAVVTGLIQGFSVLPGLSRSGLTVSALLMQKVDKETALRFSFLMSIPAVLGILFVEILIGGAILPTIDPLDLVAMEVIVFVTGLLSMEALLRLARQIRFWKLCLVLGLIAILFGIPAIL
jgi:undecaprenyl-diphosphatase